MADFHSAVTTDLGLALVADLLAGEQIVFTKLVSGCGIYTDEELKRTSLQKAVALREPRQEFGFSNIIRKTDTCILLKSRLSNEELTIGYRMTEIGVYAKKKDDEGDGILYSISVAKEADYFPHYNNLVPVEIIEEYYITVADAAEVSIQTGSGAAVLLEDFEQFKEEIKKYIADEIGKLQEQIGNLSELRTENKSNLVGAINEVSEVIKPLFEYSIATNQDIDDIISGVYSDDIDWVTTIDIALDKDIDAIIADTYVEEVEDESEDIVTDEDIDAIITGTYVEEVEDSNDTAEQEEQNEVNNS